MYSLPERETHSISSASEWFPVVLFYHDPDGNLMLLALCLHPFVCLFVLFVRLFVCLCLYTCVCRSVSLSLSQSPVPLYHVWAYMCVRVSGYVCVCMCVRVFIYSYTLQVCVCVHMCVYVCICACLPQEPRRDAPRTRGAKGDAVVSAEFELYAGKETLRSIME